MICYKCFKPEIAESSSCVRHSVWSNSFLDLYRLKNEKHFSLSPWITSQGRLPVSRGRSTIAAITVGHACARAQNCNANIVSSDFKRELYSFKRG